MYRHTVTTHTDTHTGAVGSHCMVHGTKSGLEEHFPGNLEGGNWSFTFAPAHNLSASPEDETIIAYLSYHSKHSRSRLSVRNQNLYPVKLTTAARPYGDRTHNIACMTTTALN